MLPAGIRRRARYAKYTFSQIRFLPYVAVIMKCRTKEIGASMRTITMGFALVILFVSSVIFLGQGPPPNAGDGAPLGPLVSGTDFSGSWRWLNHVDAPLFTAAGDIADWG